MKSILFIIPHLQHGGSNKCLENILTLLPVSDLDIKILSLGIEEEHQRYFQVFKPWLVKTSKFYQILFKTTLLRKTINFVHNYLHIDLWQLLYRLEAMRIENVLTPDLAIGFQEGPATWFASEFVCRKIAWIHCDYNLYREYSGGKEESEFYAKFDSVACVSEVVKKSFSQYFPSFSEKAKKIYNLINVEQVRESSICCNSVFADSAIFNIVSVGRIIEVKQYYKIPAIIKRILEIDDELSFCWYIVGDGEPQFVRDLQDEIDKNHVENYVRLLGQKDNPYPYLQQANLLVSTSRSESWSYVINEAKALHTPVVSSDSESATEVVDDQTGFISTIEDMPVLLSNLIGNKDGIYTRIVESAQLYEYRNKDIVKSLKELLCV